MSDDVTADLIRALIENMKGARDDWASLAMVLDLSGGRIRGTHGFAYSPDGTVSAVASRPSGIKVAVDACLECCLTPDQEPPAAILVQLDRSSGTYEVTFEDVDAARWKVTPANLEKISEDLRPTFDGGEWSHGGGRVRRLEARLDSQGHPRG
ncbi:MAG TPA: hypothetical protein VIT41_17670 [Microlunatus sp.]